MRCSSHSIWGRGRTKLGALIKASSVRDGHRAMRQRFGDEAFDRAIASLDYEDQVVIKALDRSTMYPLEIDGRLQQQLVDIACGGSRSCAENAFREAAGLQAEAMLDGVFSVFARFVSPAQAFARGGTIIASAYQGVTSETTAAQGATGGTIRIQGLAELTYAAPWLCGWMEQALLRFGAKRSRVTEKSWLEGTLGSDDLLFTVEWE